MTVGSVCYKGARTVRAFARHLGPDLQEEHTEFWRNCMKARQKLLAAAVAFALPLAAAAQTTTATPPEATPPVAAEPPAPKPAEPAKPAEPPKAPLVQVYGTLNVNLQYTQASESTTVTQNVKPRFAVS